MFFIKETQVCNFADDTTICSNDKHVVLNWFQIDSMVDTPRKFQIRFPGSLINNNNITLIVENKNIKGTNEVKLLGITIDHKFAFTKHINN